MSASSASDDDRPVPPHPPRSKKRNGFGRIEGLFDDLETLPAVEGGRQSPPGGRLTPPVPEASQLSLEPAAGLRLESAPAVEAPLQAAPPAVIKPEPAEARPAGPTAPPETLQAIEAQVRSVPANGKLKQSAPPHPDGGPVLQFPEVETLTPLAWESLRLGRSVTHSDCADPDGDGMPAVLAMGRPLPGGSGEENSPALLLELIDNDQERVWSDDDRILVEQVTDQLTLALENARLFQEASQRNEELTILNRIAGAVSTMMDLDSVLNEVLTGVLEAIGFSSGLITMTGAETGKLNLAIAHNLPEPTAAMLKANGLDGTLCDLVYQSGQTLYIPKLSEPPFESLAQFGEPVVLANAVRGPLQLGFQSYVGVPLVSKNVSLGTICALNSEACQINASRLHLMEAVGRQVGVVIENVRLFEQTERTRDALQISERYQKSVAQAVAALTERGITALSEVLELLGTAAQAVRVYYCETQVDQIGPYWRLLSEWRHSGATSRMSSPALRRFALDGEADWLKSVCLRGAYSADPGGKPDAALEAGFGTAALLLAVPGRQELPGCLVFEPAEAGRAWSGEETSALQTAAAALANTIAREDLFTQVQANLAETEAQYQASSRLNSAVSYADILAVLRRHTILGHVGAVEVSLNLFDRAWTRSERPEWLAPAAVWSASAPNPVSASADDERIPLGEWRTADLLLDAERPTLVLDAAADPRLDDAVRRRYVDRHAARSLLFVPLNVSGRWIGHVIGVYRQMTAFPERELRRLTSLAGQATVALEGLRLVEELQRRARQLQTAAEIARDTSSTLALDALLTRSVNLLAERFGYPGVAIYLLDESGENARIAGAAGASSAALEGRRSLAVGGRSVVGRAIAGGETLVIDDLLQAGELSPNSGEAAKAAARSELGIPLKLGEQVIGALDVQSDHSGAFAADDVAVLGILTDQIAVAVENARAYELTQKAVEEIREADRLKSQFLANMSHELRTPLNSIIGFSRVILKGIDGPVNDQQTQDLTAIYNSGQHLLGLINDVLDLSRIEAGKMDLAFENNVSLAEIIRSVMSTTVGLVKDKPIDLKQRIAPDLPPIRLDPMKVRQVLINLLSNAAKFTDDGVVSVEAERRRTADGRPGVIVRVTDSGPGIAPADQSKLFQPFSQVDGSLTRKTGGSGLGLSICQHLIRMHGGEIGLESEVGKGSTFFFILPVNPDGDTVEELAVEASALSESRSAPAATAEERGSAQDPSTLSTQTLILSVDRDPNVTELYRRYLAGLEFTVISLAALDQVAVVARSIQPFAITLDVMMQGRIGGSGNEAAPDPGDSFYIDGWQVLEALKNDPETAGIPVLVCSLAADAGRAAALGAASVLIKPILQDDLLHALQNLK